MKFMVNKLLPVFRALVASKERKIALVGVCLSLLLVLRSNTRPKSTQKVKRTHVDFAFFSRLLKLLPIVVPSLRSKEAFLLILLSLALVTRTMLSIALASVNGRIVKSIVAIDFPGFIRSILSLLTFAIPASFINSGLDYLNKTIALCFRKRLSEYFHRKYLNGMVYYQLTNLDNRIPNPDQRFTQDVEKWASTLSDLYSNVTKPILDIALFSKKLAELVGFEGPLVIIAWYFISGMIIRFISPSFGRLTAEEQELQGEYRTCHSDLVKNSEQVAFYRGNKWEKDRIMETLKKLIRHSSDIVLKRFFMGTFDSLLVKYGATMVAYAVLGLPVFGPNKERYFAMVGNDPSAITRDYIRNSSLLINLAKAIGRLVISYKELQSLAGYTSLVYKANTVLDDLSKGRYKRTMIDTCPYTHENRGKYILHDEVIFENVPIVSPNGDVLIPSLNCAIKPGMHTFIQGPNGCGKSSLFRILGELWPLFAGAVYKPPMDQIFYIPQRPYLPLGTLRDQIIYPHTVQDMRNKGVTDEMLMEMAEIVKVDELIRKRGGLEILDEWNERLSAGQKQKLAMCRLLYHKPKYALLDECTSAISLNIEDRIYQHYKDVGITLITVSHRESLLKHHGYLLLMDGEGGWQYISMKDQ